MKTKWILIAAVTLSNWVHGEVQNPSTYPPPATFESREAADKYVKGLFAGGTVTALKAGNNEVLVIFVSGSGVPDISILAYLFSAGHWKKAAELRSPTVEIHTATVSGNTVLIEGKRTGQKWVLLDCPIAPPQ